MLRSLALALVFISSAGAAIWPEQLGKYQRESATGTEKFEDLRPQWDEYGEDALEKADYGSFAALAFRFKDTTGAYAASLEPGGRVMSRVGNYLVSCSGNCPKEFLALADSSLPGVSHTPVPTLGVYLPSKGKVAASERYIMGPVGLHENLPQIAESAVALQFGTEGELARYRAAKGEETLAIFSYPTLEMARQQTPAFEAIPGAVAKRTGPMVAVALPATGQAAPDRAEAEKLLSQVNYQGSISWNEPLPLVVKPETAAQMVLGILALAGIVLGFCLVSGLLFGAVRVVARKFGYSDAGIALTTLDLSDK